jgi:hypothetical protein
MGLIILVQVIEGVLLMLKTIQFTCTPFKVSHKSFELHNISFGILKGIG